MAVSMVRTRALLLSLALWSLWGWSLWAWALPVAARAQEAPAGEVVVIEAGKVLTMNDRDEVLDHAVIVLRGGKIAALGARGEVEVPEGARVIDARDRWVVPGFVDCHDHVAGSLRNLNDGVFLTNPGLRTVDVLDPDNENLLNARAGGVTTVLLIPGSGNNMAGFGTVSRTAGKTVAEMTVRAPGSLKIAQAGNPEGYWFGVGRSFMNYNLRQTLQKARAYHERWTAWEERVQERGAAGAGPPPARDPIWHEFRGLFRKEFPTSVHTQMYQVVLETITMLHDEFKLDVMPDHCTFDGYKTAPLLVERDMPAIVGPRQYYFDRSERRLVGCAERYYAQGMRKLGINTDAPVVPQEELTLQAAIGCRLGLDPYVALKALTIVPARALGIAEHAGSLEVGKDADFGVWTGDPIDPSRACQQTWVQGRLVYDAKKKRRF
ncbi:MAG: amidohydrolase family protein [Planctomycetota bacterium]